MNLKLPASVALLTIAVLLLAAAEARGGTYVVRQCHHTAPQNTSHEAARASFPDPGPYALFSEESRCQSAAGEYALRVEPEDPASHGQHGLLTFSAPPGTRITGAELDARLRGEAGHRARLFMADAAGGERVRFGAGGPGPASFERYRWPVAAPPGPAGHAKLAAGLVCSNPGFSCPLTGGGADSAVEIRKVKLTLRDDAAPTVALSGSLVSGGWKRGEHEVVADFADRGGGLRAAAIAVNGESVPGSLVLSCRLIPGTTDARSLIPCPESYRPKPSLDTAAAPFADGDNELLACGLDHGSDPNGGCETRTIKVDNSAPELAFSDAQDRSDPERIAAPATDPASGLAASSAAIEFRRVGDPSWSGLPTRVDGSELWARVDSGAFPPGDYEFRASVADRAGNGAATTRRADGRPMLLRFPLKDEADLRARLGNGADSQTVRFREDGEVQGRLLDEAGRPIAGAEVEVIETFEEGALLSARRRTVRTNRHGRYASALPGGPSRNVGVSFGGSRRYRADAEGGLDFDVRGSAELKVSKRRVRAGRAVAFRGRVKRYFAQIPPGGKLVEVQVKTPTGWTTLQEATGSDRKGRVRIRHRFRGFYTRPVTFTFRLKATRESGWPYRGAAKSKRRKVTVLPKR